EGRSLLLRLARISSARAACVMLSRDAFRPGQGENEISGKRKKLGGAAAKDRHPDGERIGDRNGTGTQGAGSGRLARALGAIERAGNRLPDPALLFFLLMLLTWAVAALLSQ